MISDLWKIEFFNLASLLKMSLYDALIYILGIFIAGIISSALISFFTLQKRGIFEQLRSICASRIFVISEIISVLIFLFCITLYGLSEYALFIACILYLLYIMAYIDSVLLAIPDILNFFCLFFIFIGLYYFDLLQEEHLISAFCAAGFLSLLRIFGGFVFSKEILGEADIVLFASMSSIVLFKQSLYLIFISSIFAMSYILIIAFKSLKNKQLALSSVKIPFAVFLSLGFVTMLIYLRFYEGMNV